MTQLSSPAVLLLGEPGAGKTFSLGTLAAVRKIFYLFTDPGGDESLINALMHYKVPLTNVHWHYVSAAPDSWDAMLELGNTVNTTTYEGLGLMKAGIERKTHRQLLEIFDTLKNFKCDRTGENFGSASEWGDDCAFVFDSISGLNQLAREVVVGAKPTLHQGEWGVAMNVLEKTIRIMVSNIRCTKVMIGHLDTTTDLATGRRILSAALLGQKLAKSGVILRLFSDVIQAYGEGGKFYWNTATDTEIALKTRNLPIGNKLPPDFRLLLESYEARKKLIEAELPQG